MVREAKEEIGLELNSVPGKLFKIEAHEETGNEFTWVYHVTASGPFVFDPCEVTELRWFKLKEVDRLIQEQEDSFLPLSWRSSDVYLDEMDSLHQAYEDLVVLMTAAPIL